LRSSLPLRFLVLAALAATAACSTQPLRADGFPEVFQTTAVYSSDSRPFTNWSGAMTRAHQQIATAPPCAPGAASVCRPAEWDAILAEASSADLRRKVEIVNQRINAHPYVTSMQNWGVTNYWETPFEFLMRNGQCQDYAITKYLLLRGTGVPDDLMRVAIVHDNISRLDHAILLVEVDGQALVLDNQASLVLPATAVTRYAPYYAINETGWWLMRRDRFRPEVAALPGGAIRNAN
jgi:predicted transglutaminase-like cysteine proteinase